MEPVYYRDASLGCCPVKKYLKRYIKNDADKPKERNRKYKVLAELNMRIQYVLQNNGITAPPLIKKLSGYDYFEIRSKKNHNILIRVFWFRHGDMIVLLNALEKPENYTGERENMRIKKELDVTQTYLNKFKINPKLYEKYDYQIS
jgi:hypothetical protein